METVIVQDLDLVLEALDKLIFIGQVLIISTSAIWAAMFVRLFLYALNSRGL